MNDILGLLIFLSVGIGLIYFAHYVLPRHFDPDNLQVCKNKFDSLMDNINSCATRTALSSIEDEVYNFYDDVKALVPYEVAMEKEISLKQAYINRWEALCVKKQFYTTYPLSVN